jgi:SAM-dependent methyltransferase
MEESAHSDLAEVNFTRDRMAHWDAIAMQADHWRNWGYFYHQRLAAVYQFLVAPGQRVLEIGCGKGDLLAALQPKLGVGLDFSGEAIAKAAQTYPDLKFIHADAHNFYSQGKLIEAEFDVIILSDLVNDLWDVQAVFEQIAQICTPRTRLILNVYSKLWETPLNLVRSMGLAKPLRSQNWLTVDDLTNLLDLTDFEVIRSWREVLLPLPVPLITAIANRYLVKLPVLNQGAMVNFVLARPSPKSHKPDSLPKVSVIIPARNEAGNIANILATTPEMGSGTELVFVEGHSTDHTYQTIKDAIANHPERQCQLLQQPGKGKGDAVRMGFAHANGDILMILDADLTVPPEDLVRFYEVLRSGKGEFINGVRLVYPMQDEAMRFLNLVANKSFCLAFSWLLGQTVKDTLCGTKVLWKEDYEQIVTNRAYFGDFDPFGDFDLLFGAAKLNLKIVDLPIRYRARTYGTTNIQRWRHGWLLLQMVLFAARRIKFV